MIQKLRFLALLLPITLLYSTLNFAQCVVNSTNGYQVSVSICPQSVVVSNTNCPNGYNYNLNFSYNIVMTGAAQQLYTLQTIMYCNGGQELGYFSLPKNGGSGTAVTTTNPWIGVDGAQNNYITHPDCNSATVQNLQCLTLDVIIHGPGIPNQTISCNCTALALPVTFLGFEVEKKEMSNVLTWSTETESRNEFFTLEVSDDATNWSKVIDVEAAGNSTERKKYSFEDVQNSDRSVYYKLSQTDEDGTRNELAMVYVNRNQEDFVVFPNPTAGEQLSLQFPSNFKKDTRVRFYNELGAVAEELNFSGSVLFGENKQVVALKLSKGIYLVEFETDAKEVYRSKLVVE